MFDKIKRIKDVRLLNATLKEARLKLLHEHAVENEINALAIYHDFESERKVKEALIVQGVLGKVVQQSDLGLMNEKINILRNEEANLAIEHQDRKAEERQAYSQWLESVELRKHSQRKVDKLNVVCEMENEKHLMKVQYQEDMELEEFKAISNILDGIDE